MAASALPDPSRGSKMPTYRPSMALASRTPGWCWPRASASLSASVSLGATSLSLPVKRRAFRSTLADNWSRRFMELRRRSAACSGPDPDWAVGGGGGGGGGVNWWMPARLTRFDIVLHAICTERRGRSIPRSSGRSWTMSWRKRVRVTRPPAVAEEPTGGVMGTLPSASAWMPLLILPPFATGPADPLPILPTTGDCTAAAVWSSYLPGDGSVVMGCTRRAVPDIVPLR
mmetsp:Transcript_13458/g.38460  ORF Transcript_13458/g.38460 Transcript_13458/m.38460 type:complete len:229 (+) Transcript_13458:794-1480(+)